MTEDTHPAPDPLAAIRPFLDEHGRLTQWPRKLSRKLVAAEYLAARFEHGRIYAESQVNDVLEDWHTFNDAAVLRRFLVDLGIMQRVKDGSRYWLTDPDSSS
jgi:hypothetical protein